MPTYGRTRAAVLDLCLSRGSKHVRVRKKSVIYSFIILEYQPEEKGECGWKGGHSSLIRHLNTKGTSPVCQGPVQALERT